MRMFDRGNGMVLAPARAKPELCIHIWSQEGTPMYLTRPGNGPAWATVVEGVGYKCVDCGSYWVLPQHKETDDREGQTRRDS